MTENTKDFDLLAFAKGRSRAKDHVELYMDEDAANEMAKHLKYRDGEVVGVEDKNKDQYTAALERLKESAITVYLEGLPEGRVEELRGEFEVKGDGNDDDDNYESWIVAVLAEMYQKTVTATEQETDKTLTTEEWFEFKKAMPRSQWMKLLVKVKELIFVSGVIDDGVDAGFSLKS